MTATTEPSTATTLRDRLTPDGPPLTINIEAGGDRADPDDAGQGMVSYTFTAATLRRVVPVGMHRIVTGEHDEWTTDLLGDLLEDSGEVAEDLRDTDEDGDPIIGDDEELTTGNVDAVIALIRVAHDRGEPLELRADTDGSAFWVFHDVEHARCDAWTDAAYGEHGAAGISGPLQGDDESAATMRAARAAIRAGVDAAEVLRELLDNETPFLNRFGYEANHAAELLKGATITFQD